MKHAQIVKMVSDKVKSTIELPTPSFDFSFWKGYCYAMEDNNGIGRNDVWIAVKVIALEYCDTLRNREPIAGIATVTTTI